MRGEAGAPVSLPLLPLRDVVVLPWMPVPLVVGRPASVAAVRAAQRGGGELLLLTQRRAEVMRPTPEDLPEIGTIADIEDVIELPDGHLKVLLHGRRRGKVMQWRRSVGDDEVWTAEVGRAQVSGGDDPSLPEQVQAIRDALGRLVDLTEEAPDHPLQGVSAQADPEEVIDRVAASLQVPVRERALLLAELDLPARASLVMGLLRKEIGFLEAKRKLRVRVDRARERQGASPGAGDPSGGSDSTQEEPNELDELEASLGAAGLPEAVAERASRELRRLRSMNPMSAEATVARSWLDWVVQLPWSPSPHRSPSLSRAVEVLDEDHHGLEDVKERVLEYLAADLLSEGRGGPVLCLVGPPGVGKTSLARSIARATDRPFARLALGGVRDEAEIRGHRRTYIGAMPGRLLHAMKRAGATDALVLLDEIDKMGADVRGDPASALLEVLDPEQHREFNDHYLDMDYDLSGVLFVCTANRSADIPVPLRDRLEMVELGSYTDEEKRRIASRYLFPRQQRQAGLSEGALTLSDEAIDVLIARYTREAGVRELERVLGRVCRKRARAWLERGDEEPWHLGAEDVGSLLGPPRFDRRVVEPTEEVGVVRGLSVGPSGGEVLEIEVALVPGKGGLRTTGRAGDVLKESAEAARTWLRGRAPSCGLAEDWHERFDLHIHYPGLPSGVEGPSAGLAMAVALVSVATGRPVRADVAMTGEISLRGRVLPVGGVKDKVLAAWRDGISVVILPARNEHDLAKLPDEVRASLEVRCVGHIDEILPWVLVPEESELSSGAPGRGEEMRGDDVAAGDSPVISVSADGAPGG